MWSLAETKWQFWRRLMRRRELAALLLLSATLLFMDRSGTHISRQVQLWVSDAAVPLLELTAHVGRISENFRQSIRNHFDVVALNERLRSENAELLEWRERFLESQHRLQRYEELLRVAHVPETLSLTARVVGESGGPFEQAVILQAGREHGVTYGSGVVDARGLVGRIVGVGRRTSRVLLLTDFNSSIPVLIKPGDVTGIVGGDNSAFLNLQYFPENVTLSAGDQVITSGDGGFLPAGLPVGEIAGFRADAPIIRPFSEKDRLEWVRVLKETSLHDVPSDDVAGPLAERNVAVSTKEKAPLP